MLLEILITEQSDKERGWTVEEDNILVAKVTGYRKSEIFERWSLDPSLPSFVTEIESFTDLYLRKHIDTGETMLVAEQEINGEDEETFVFTAVIPVAYVKVVGNFPHP